jgi:hypothetical protein
MKQAMYARFFVANAKHKARETATKRPNCYATQKPVHGRHNRYKSAYRQRVDVFKPY